MNWTTVDIVRDALGLDPSDTVDDAWLALCVAAVNRFVDSTRSSVPTDTDEQTTWGATQLATRWYSRRNSTDISAFVEFGGPPPSIDRDIEVSLKLGRFFGPAVA